MTVKRVVNQSGPQTADRCRTAVHQHTPQRVTEGSLSLTTEFPLPAGINERLSSMETHVKPSAGNYSQGVLNCIENASYNIDTFYLSWSLMLNAVSQYRYAVFSKKIFLIIQILIVMKICTDYSKGKALGYLLVLYTQVTTISDSPELISITIVSLVLSIRTKCTNTETRRPTKVKTTVAALQTTTKWKKELSAKTSGRVLLTEVIRDNGGRW